MAKYRKNRVVIEAFQLTEETERDNSGWPEWMHRAWNKGIGEVGEIYPSETENFDSALDIKTLEGVMTVNRGDYIIKGVKGEIYPCKEEIFNLTYEPLE